MSEFKRVLLREAIMDLARTAYEIGWWVGAIVGSVNVFFITVLLQGESPLRGWMVIFPIFGTALLSALTSRRVCATAREVADCV